MADNTVLSTNIGTGDTIHTDDLTAGTYKMATSKIIFGTSGNNDAYWAAGAGAVGSDVGRVTLASDDPAVALLGTIDTDTGVIAGDTTSIDGKITACDTGAVVISSGAVTATLSATDNAVLDDIAARTSDPTVYTDDGDWTPLSSKHALIGGVYQSTPGTITDGDTGPIRVDSNGHVIINPHTATGALTDNSSNTARLWVDQDDNYAVQVVFPYYFDGSTWDRARGDATNGLLVNLGSNNDVTLATLPDTASSDLAAHTTSLQLIDNAVSGAGFNITQLGGASVPIGAGVEATALRVTLATDSTGVVSIDDNGGSLTVDNGGTFAVQSTLQAGTASVGHVVVEASASATGTSTFYDNDLDETKIEVTDNPNVSIYSIHAINTTNAPLYLQMFDLDADNVTVGTTTPTNQYIIPGNNDTDGSGFVLTFAIPKSYSTGFTVACTTDSEGSAAPGGNACHVNIEYISAA